MKLIIFVTFSVPDGEEDLIIYFLFQCSLKRGRDQYNFGPV